MVLLMVRRIAMPDSLIPYKFCDKHLCDVILGQSQVVRHLIGKVKAPAGIVFNPVVCMCRIKTSEFVCKGY